jgi:hypothetical protein
MNLYDATGRTFLKFHRPLKDCDCVCCGNHMQPDKIMCTSTNGELCASIEQQASKGFCWSLDTFTINDKDGAAVLKFERACNCCDQHEEFPIYAMDGTTKVGRIIKLFGMGNTTNVKDADEFECHFPMDIDVRVKAACIAAVFLIDMMYFEEGSDE